MDELKPTYGTVKPLRSWNPIWSNLEIYHQMIRDSFYTKGIKNKLRVWFSSTRWRPDDVLEMFPHFSNDMNSFVKYDPECDSATKTFSLIQFTNNSIISTALIFTVSDQSYAITWMVAAMLVFSTTLVNLILENKQWAVNLEIIRSLFVVTAYLSFNTQPSVLTIDLFFYQALMSIFYLLIFLPINNRLSIIK